MEMSSPSSVASSWPHTIPYPTSQVSPTPWESCCRSIQNQIMGMGPSTAECFRDPKKSCVEHSCPALMQLERRGYVAVWCLKVGLEAAVLQNSQPVEYAYSNQDPVNTDWKGAACHCVLLMTTLKNTSMEGMQSKFKPTINQSWKSLSRVHPTG